MSKTMHQLFGVAIMTLLFMFTPYVYAIEYHVSKQGNDQNDGSESRPFQTIQAAAEVAQPGDTITVHTGVYRERVNPPRGGTSDIRRITYRAAEGERVEIKGSEVISNWKRIDGNVWQVVLPNTFFGDYHPYQDTLTGDWLDKKGINHHTGEVYLNGQALFERNTLAEVQQPKPYPDALNQRASTYTWFCQTTADSTTLWANFHEANPNEALVEINVRPSCFYPDRPRRNFITVQGFRMNQAATQWAAPTAEQVGLIGTHWSKGWRIEDNIISHSKCVGITLGKDRQTGHNVWSQNPAKDGTTHYNEVIFRALNNDWSRETIGSHVVRNNTIRDCGQAGIVGSLGAVFSEISHNHIYDIWTRRTFAGYEMAGIKIHASVDMLIEHNRIHNTGRGIWIDWMAQGLRISRNLLYDNTTDDIFSEVNHGPYVVDNNILLSEIALRDWSEGGAYVHNLVGGKVTIYAVKGRSTPYLVPHSTQVAGLKNITNGDNRFYNNIFIIGQSPAVAHSENHVEFYGLAGYDSAGFASPTQGNVLLGGAAPARSAPGIAAVPFDPDVRLEEREGEVRLHMAYPDSLNEELTLPLVTTARLGTTKTSEAVFEQPDGSPLTIDTDYFGNARQSNDPVPGPFGNYQRGGHTYKLW